MVEMIGAILYGMFLGMVETYLEVAVFEGSPHPLVSPITIGLLAIHVCIESNGSVKLLVKLYPIAMVGGIIGTALAKILL